VGATEQSSELTARRNEEGEILKKHNTIHESNHIETKGKQEIEREEHSNYISRPEIPFFFGPPERIRQN